MNTARMLQTNSMAASMIARLFSISWHCASSVPDDEQEREQWLHAIRDDVFHIREGFVMPAIPLNFERIMRVLGQDARDDLFLLELDDELRKIRMNRWKEESKLRQKIFDERKFMGQGLTTEGAFDKLTALVRKFIPE